MGRLPWLVWWAQSHHKALIKAWAHRQPLGAGKGDAGRLITPGASRRNAELPARFSSRPEPCDSKCVLFSPTECVVIYRSMRTLPSGPFEWLTNDRNCRVTAFARWESVSSLFLVPSPLDSRDLRLCSSAWRWAASGRKVLFPGGVQCQAQSFTFTFDSHNDLVNPTFTNEEDEAQRGEGSHH